MSVIRVTCTSVVAAALCLAASPVHAQPVPPARLSVRTNGAQNAQASTLLGVSHNGRHVLFSTTGPLVDEDLNGHNDLYVRDRDTDADGIFDEPGAVRTVLVSVGPGGRQLGPMPPDIGTFTGGVLSGDGRFVHFTTGWPLVIEDTNDRPDGYLFDRDLDGDGVFDELDAAGVSQVTTGSGNTQATGGAGSEVLQVTSDGRYVLFRSSATNLQPRATAVAQIYRKDRVTSLTTLVSSTPDGTPADATTKPISGLMRDDGRIVALAGGFTSLWPLTAGVATYPWVIRDLDTNTFTPVYAPPKSSPSTNPATAPDSLIGGFSPDGQRVFLSDIVGILGLLGYRTGWTVEYDLVGSRELQRIPGFTPLSGDRTIRDGRSLPLLLVESFSPSYNMGGFSRYDVVTGRMTRLVPVDASFPVGSTANRRTLYTAIATPPTLLDERYGVPLPMPDPVRKGTLDATGSTVFFTSGEATILPGGSDTNGVDDVFAVDLLSRLDRDGDGLDDRWEVAVGLDYTSSAGADGATGDPDGDGQTNLQEQTSGSHPRGTSRQFLAEGAQNQFFKTRLGIANPGTTAATAVVRFDGDGGASSAVTVHVPAGAKRTLFVDDIAPPSASFSIEVESSAPLVSDRTMSWDATEYGAHAERAGAAPATTWFLAEGSTGGFGLFYLLQNPGDTAAAATVRYLRPTPLAPIDRVYTLPPHSRTTVPVNTQAPELAGTDVSASITSTQPILVERAMYRTVGGQVFAAGHASAGVTAAATSWFLAEGATGPFFDMFVLLANPNTSAANVEIRYLLTGGTVLTKTYTVAPESRRTVYVDEEDFPGLGRALDNVAVSCAITSTNAVPIVVERAMWFPGPTISPNFWTEAHNSPGVTTTARRWVLADAESGGAKATQTYVLIANTSSTAGQARLTFLPDPTFVGGPLPQPYTVDLPANSRTTIPFHSILGVGVDYRFGLLVESVGTTPADLVVERAMYWNAGGETWAAGTNLLATPIP
jgi:hypothetical protein